jgi:hypothetical protein
MAARKENISIEIPRQQRCYQSRNVNTRSFELHLVCRAESIQTLTWKRVCRTFLMNFVSDIPVLSVITFYFTDISR